MIAARFEIESDSFWSYASSENRCLFSAMIRSAAAILKGSRIVLSFTRTSSPAMRRSRAARLGWHDMLGLRTLAWMAAVNLRSLTLWVAYLETRCLSIGPSTRGSTGPTPSLLDAILIQPQVGNTSCNHTDIPIERGGVGPAVLPYTSKTQ